MLLVLAGCHKGLSDEDFQDPQTCKKCHADHYEQWSGSMHAYASVDPVFRAMEAMGQRETDGNLGDFCVRCHAPAGVALGEVKTGADIDDARAGMTGVTCWFCHQVDEVKGDHTSDKLSPLHVAQDRVMRGPIRDPVENDVHDSAYSALHDRYDLQSSGMCGSCHDIVTPLGGHIESTYAEWRTSLFASPGFGLTCAGCHMTGSDGLAAKGDGLDVKLRRVHDHGFPGVDRAVVDFPDADRQTGLVQGLLDDTVNAFLCVDPTQNGAVAVSVLENVAAGHLFPSGASADRRVWVEVTAYQGDQVVYHSGAPDPRIGEVTPDQDPDLWKMWSRLLDDVGAPTHKFWEAASIETGELLPVATTLDAKSPDYVQTHLQHPYVLDGVVPDKITMSVHVQPIGGEILDELVDAGDLDPSVVDAIQPMTLRPTVVTWTPDVPVNSGEYACAPEVPPVTVVVP